LERAALQDPLTGLPNRRSLENHFAICEATARRKNRRFTILLIDLDHFKQINDHFGHDTGDVVLIEAAIRLRDAVRQCDIVARLGGDEFMLLLPETSDRTDVETVCQRLSTILANPIAVRGKTICTTASIGIAMFPDDVANWQTAYKAADLALYQAKRSGRGTWKWYDSSCLDSALYSTEPVQV
jgi:diguanylate cyclase (GGDEF)-like protein